jgi:hypothetical protein
MQESVTTIYQIATLLNISYDKAFQACQEMCATSPVPTTALSYIYQQAAAGRSLDQIREDFGPWENRQGNYHHGVETIVTMYKAGVFGQEEAAYYLQKLAHRMKAESEQ